MMKYWAVTAAILSSIAVCAADDNAANLANTAIFRAARPRQVQTPPSAATPQPATSTASTPAATSSPATASTAATAATSASASTLAAALAPATASTPAIASTSAMAPTPATASTPATSTTPSDTPNFLSEAKWLMAGYNNNEIVYTILVTNRDSRILRCTTDMNGFYLENGARQAVSDRQVTTVFPNQPTQVGNWMDMDQKSGATYSVKCKAV